MPLDVAGLAAYPAEIFETVVIRLKLIIGNAPILIVRSGPQASRNFFRSAAGYAFVDEVSHLRAETLAVQWTNEPRGQSRAKSFPSGGW